jgi:hypothetical protein
MWGKPANSALLPRTSTPIDWRRIEAALFNFFGGQNDNGNLIAELQAYEDPEGDCDSCPLHFADIDLTELARFLADELGGAP